MKKLLATLLASTMALSVVGGLAACGGDAKDDNVITIWAPLNSIKGYQSMIAGFKEEYPEYAKYEYKFVAKGEGDVQGDMGTNPAAGAEVFFFASDHYGNMRHSNYLTPLTSEYETKVKARDSEGTYEFVTDDDKIYAFPTTNDNGFFLWYDSSKLTAEEVKSLDTIMARCQEEGWKMHFDYGNSWYAGTFMFGLGCKFNYEDTTMAHYHGDFNTPEAYAAGEAMLHYSDDSVNLISPASGDKAAEYVINIYSDPGAGFASGELAAAISYVSAYSDFQTAFAANGNEADLANIKATVLPTFKATLNDVEGTYHMGTFYGGKYCGVNRAKSEAKILVSLALADWFTNENGQTIRFQTDGSGPSNLNVAATEAVQSSIGLAAYNAQVALGTEVNCVQGAQSDDFWGDSGITVFSKGLFDHDSSGNRTYSTSAQVKKALDDLAAALNK